MYFVVYPSPVQAAKPELSLEFFREGQLIARAAPGLPSPDDEGRIAYVASFPTDSFAPGQYEVRAVIRQGSTAAEENALFTVGP